MWRCRDGEWVGAFIKVPVFRWPAIKDGEKMLLGLFITTLVMPGIPKVLVRVYFLSPLKYGFFFLSIVSFSSLCFHTQYWLKVNACSFIVSFVPLRLTFTVERFGGNGLTQLLYYIAELCLSYYSMDKRHHNKISWLLSIITFSFELLFVRVLFTYTIVYYNKHSPPK